MPLHRAIWRRSVRDHGPEGSFVFDSEEIRGNPYLWRRFQGERAVLSTAFKSGVPKEIMSDLYGEVAFYMKPSDQHRTMETIQDDDGTGQLKVLIKKYITTDYANESDALMSILSAAKHLSYRNPIIKMKAHCMPALKLLEKGNTIISPDTTLYAVRDLLLQRVGTDSSFKRVLEQDDFKDVQPRDTVRRFMRLCSAMYGAEDDWKKRNQHRASLWMTGGPLVPGSSARRLTLSQ